MMNHPSPATKPQQDKELVWGPLLPPLLAPCKTRGEQRGGSKAVLLNLSISISLQPACFVSVAIAWVEWGKTSLIAGERFWWDGV